MPMAVSMAEFPSTPPLFEPGNQSEKNEQKRRLRDLLSLGRWRSRDVQAPAPESQQDPPPQTPARPGFGTRFSRKGLVGIPRSTTFKRQEEEQRKNLTPVEQTIKERRDVSKVRQRALSSVPIPPRSVRRERSVPENLHDVYPSIAERIDQNAFAQLTAAQHEQVPPPPPPPPQPPPQEPDPQQDDSSVSGNSYDDAVDEEIMEELKKKWILNLSMHFRDNSPREKFFLTYAEMPERWRRVTVSCDYRDVPLDSLENDLQNLHYQKDKSARIYESIRMSLPDIQFYDTVTNLKLETKDDRLHVHVTEDVNEIIPYPPVQLVDHIKDLCPFYQENELHFDEHMSGFVYRVTVSDSTWIKKEIPGPDSVDEFLYEVNALSELINSKNVVQLKGLVINNERTLVKGLLLGYAEQGALIDILYDSKEGHIPHVQWERRERWTKQIIQGLSNIHEAGFVQGDFTLSNIVIDENDEAQIIDINRRGCPVGWESPEMVPLVQSGQRLSMYIGVKSDLYQLGMVLWALAMQQDEPERARRPLSLQSAGPDIPHYYHLLTEICLKPKPKERLSAKELLMMLQEPALLSELHRRDRFPASESSRPATGQQDGVSFGQGEDADHLGESFAERESRYRVINHQIADLARQAHIYRLHPKRRSSDKDGEGIRGRRYSPIHSGSMGIPMDGSPSLSISRKDHHPASNLRQLSFTGRSEQPSPTQSEYNDAQVVTISPTGDREWEEVNGLDGTPYLVHRDTLDDFDLIESGNNVQGGKNVDRWRRNIGDLGHIDSGLGDMDLSDFRPGLLAGVGEHTSSSPGPSTDAKDIPRDITVDLGPPEHQPKDSYDAEKPLDSTTLENDNDTRVDSQKTAVDGETRIQAVTENMGLTDPFPHDIEQIPVTKTDSQNIPAHPSDEQHISMMVPNDQLPTPTTEQRLNRSHSFQGKTDDLKFQNHDNEHESHGVMNQ